MTFLRRIPMFSLVALSGSLAACMFLDLGEQGGEPGGSSDGEGESSEDEGESEDEASPTGSEGPSESGGFIPMCDYASCALPCDPYSQDCADGEKCVAYASTGVTYDSNKCVPVTGDHHAGESCIYTGIVEAHDDCDEHSTCWGAKEVDGELVGTCTPFCQGSLDDPQCGDMDAAQGCGSTCLQSNGAFLNLCVEQCDPTGQDCEAGESCRWSGSGFHCLNTPDADNPLTINKPCADHEQCAPGLACIDSQLLPNCAGDSCCTALCDLEAEDDGCAVHPGTTCQSWFRDEASCTEGVCLSP